MEVTIAGAGMSTLAEFRLETRAWIEENLPASLRGTSEVFNGGRKTPLANPESVGQRSAQPPGRRDTAAPG